MDDITSTITSVLNFVSARSAWGAVFALVGFGLQLSIRGEWPTGRTNDGAPQILDPKALATAVAASVLIGVAAANFFDLDVTKAAVREGTMLGSVVAQAQSGLDDAQAAAKIAQAQLDDARDRVKTDPNNDDLKLRQQEAERQSARAQKQVESEAEILATAKRARDASDQVTGVIVPARIRRQLRADEGRSRQEQSVRFAQGSGRETDDRSVQADGGESGGRRRE